MKKIFLLFSVIISMQLLAQDDTTIVEVIADTSQKEEMGQPAKVFYSQKLINANTVEVLRKGVMDFRVVHNFGDIAGPFGGVKNFFGLDAAADIKIGFQIGLGDRLNIIAARAKGSGVVLQLWELGLKYQMMRQYENDPKRPLSMTIYANTVASGMKRNPNPNLESSFSSFSDRLSQLIQLMIAKKFGNFSLQVSPTFVHTNYVVPGDQNSVFALGGAARLPITKKFFLIADYFHAFRSQESKDALRNLGVELFDAFGVGVEILTEGHIFHMNFTNATSILENRFIPRTFTGWGEGKYRWGFTISRRFVLFRDKRQESMDQ